MLTYEESLATTSELLKSHLPEGRVVKPTDHIQSDLGLDSLGVMELVADIETKFEVNIPQEMFEKISTVDDIARAVVQLRHG